MLKLIFSVPCRTRFIVKEIMCRNLSTTAHDKPFQTRILKYFENTLQTQKSLQQNEESTPYIENTSKINDILINSENHTSVDEKLETICQDINNLLHEKDSEIRQNLVNIYDLKCIQIFNTLTPSQVLSLLNTFFKVIGKNITMIYIYEKSLLMLLNCAENGYLSNHDLVQLLYFISLKGNNGIYLMNRLKPFLPDLDNISLFEKCIIARVFYKSSTKLELRQARILEKVIKDEFDQLINDSPLLILLCKAVIISEPSNQMCLKNVSKNIMELKQPLSFETMAHLLYLYAEAHLLESEVINRLTQNCIDIIREDNTYNRSNLRFENVNIFLWSISYLGLILTMDEKLVLKLHLEKRFTNYKKKFSLNHLVSTILSLHILRCWHTQILKKCFKEGIFYPVINEKFHWKVKARLHLLVTQIMHEMKIEVPEYLQCSAKIGYTPSERLDLVADIAHGLTSTGIIKRVSLECPIDALAIPGVTIATDRSTYHIDILDDSTCFKNTNTPHGLMHLKLRLLSRLRYRPILLHRHIFDEDSGKTENAIKEKIINEIAYGKASALFNKNDSAAL